MRSSKRILREIGGIGPVIHGSLVEAKRTCGNKRCKCARGELHSAFYLSRSIKGKTKLEHVSRDNVKTVREWIQSHKQLCELIEELTTTLVQELRQARKKASSDK